MSLRELNSFEIVQGVVPEVTRPLDRLTVSHRFRITARWARSIPWGLAITTVLFLGFGLHHLSLPGPYGDEVIQAAPAAHIAAGTLPVAKPPLPSNSLILFDRVWPFMTLSYLGPVKTYLLAATFAIFGVSVGVMRVTTLFSGLLGVYFLYLFSREVFNRLTAEIVVLLVGIDTSYLVFSRDDWGPIAIGFAAKMCGLYFFARWWHHSKARLAPFLVGLAFGIGMSHKADFAWFLLAGVPVALLLYRTDRRIFTIGSVFVSVGFLVGAAPLLYYNVSSGWATWTSPGDSFFQSLPMSGPITMLGVAIADLFMTNLQHRWALLTLVLDGRGVTEYVVGSAPSYVSFVLQKSSLVSGYPTTTLNTTLGFLKLTTEEILVVLSLALVAAAARMRESLRLVRPWVACLMATVLIFAQVVITPAATGPHHSIAIYPFPQLMIAFGLSQVPSLFSMFLRRQERLSLPVHSRRARYRYAAVFGLALSVGLFGVVLGCDVGQLIQFERGLDRTGGHGYWSDAIDQAANYIQQRYPNKYVETLDWGLRDQLVVLFGGHVPVGFWAADANVAAELDAELAAGRHVFVLHTAPWTLFKTERSQFMSQLNDPRLGPLDIRRFSGRAQSPSVVVVAIPERHETSLLRRFPAAAVVPPAGNAPQVGLRQVTIRGVRHDAILAHPLSTVTYAGITIPMNSRLTFATGIDPSCMAASAGARFEVDVRSPRGMDLVFSRSMQPKSNPADRYWQTGSVSLDGWANQNVDISFVTKPINGDYSCAWSLWGDPELNSYNRE